MKSVRLHGVEECRRVLRAVRVNTKMVESYCDGIYEDGITCYYEDITLSNLIEDFDLYCFSTNFIGYLQEKEENESSAE